jgi:hypothetical protein
MAIPLVLWTENGKNGETDMKIHLTALGALVALAGCQNDATPAQEQQAEQLEERADAVEEAGDQRADMIEDRAEAQAEALEERADDLEDGEVPVANEPVGTTGTQDN